MAPETVPVLAVLAYTAIGCAVAALTPGQPGADHLTRRACSLAITVVWPLTLSIRLVRARMRSSR